MTTIQYAAALLYCGHEADLCLKVKDREGARRYEALATSLEAEIRTRGRLFSEAVEDRLQELLDAPDLVDDLAAAFVESLI